MLGVIAIGPPHFADGCVRSALPGLVDRSPVPLLLVGTLADPNTAYVSTLAAATGLGNARVLTETGGGHTALINQSACASRYTSAYLIDGSLPAPGTVCNQDKPPL